MFDNSGGRAVIRAKQRHALLACVGLSNEGRRCLDKQREFESSRLWRGVQGGSSLGARQLEAAARMDSRCACSEGVHLWGTACPCFLRLEPPRELPARVPHIS